MAFTQLQLAQILNTLPETGRKLSECLAAAEGLEAAIVSLDKIATQPHPPYSKSSIEGRAAMARNTMRKQLERTITSQRSYEEAEAEKVRKALALRAAELERRERVQREAEEREAQRKRLIAEERAKIAAADREMAERRAREAEEREEAEWTQDEETGERVKRTKKKRAPRKKREGSESGSEDDKPKRRRAKKKADSGDEADQPAKKRRLTKKGGKAVSKKGDANFKSAEVVVDSDEDAEGAGGESDAGRDVRAASVMSQLAINSDDEDEVIAKPTARRDRRRNVMSDDEDEDEEMGDADAPSTQVPAESVESPSQDVDAATTPAGGDFAPVTSTNVRSPSPTGGADEKVERGTEDVQDGGVTTTGLAIGEVNATSPARDRVAGEIPEDEPMGDADAMDGGDDAEEKEGQVDR